MKRRTQIILIIAIFPLLLVVFTVVHELGHTILARLMGDPDSVFYLYKIEETSACLGCNIYNQTRLSYAGNLIVSIAGLGFTQVAAFLALIGRRYVRTDTFPQRLLNAVGLSFAFLDVPVQVIQGLLYDISRHTWPTNVDLMDFMLLITMRTGASQGVMKTILVLITIAYLYGVVRFYKAGLFKKQGQS